METFEIQDEYIQLNQLLKVMNWCESGAHANQLIEDGNIKVNGKKELRKRNKIYRETVVEFQKNKVKII